MIGGRMLTTILLLAALPGSSPGGEARARAADLEKMKEWLDLEHSFTDARREEARSVITAHLEKATEFTEAGFYMEVRRIVALAGNGHSNVSVGPIHERFGLLPLRTYWFADGLYVVRAREAHVALLGTRIEAVEGRPIGELETRLLAYVGGTVEYFRAFTAAQLLLSPALMHAVGLAEGPDRLRLKVVDGKGKSTESVVEVDPGSSSLRERPWRYLNPAPIEGSDGWTTALAPGAELPLWLRDERETFRYVRLAGGDVAYVQLRANHDYGSSRIRDFADQTLEHLQRDQPRSIVLDDRQNGGGDLTTTADFALELPSFVRPGGRVYVLTGNGTFSAGIYTSFYPKASDPEHTVVVGERVGDRPEFWAEDGLPFVLPEAGFGIGYALQRHDVVRGCTVPSECHMAQHPAHWNLAVETLEPDWPVPTTFADYASGRDPALERVLAHEAGQR
jgi:hypothetical protein